MAERGTYFDPNIGLVLQNYAANKSRFLGIGNFTEEGFSFMCRRKHFSFTYLCRVLRKISFCFI